MKWKVLFGALCIILMGSTAYADEGTYIVQFNNKAQMFATESEQRHESRNYTIATHEELQEYLDAEIVEYYEPNYEVRLFETNNTLESSSTNWNLNAISCEFAWDIGCYGNEVNVAVIDSGICFEDSTELYCSPGYNYLTGTDDTTDNIGHGTFVSGIIASKSYGISYNCTVVPLKCFDTNVRTYVSDILNAIYDAVDVYNCKVINMSFGLESHSAKFQRAITYAVNNGAIVVASVGNDGTDTLYYPAAYENVIGVGSIDTSLNCSSFSQHNESVMVTAPGENLNSLCIPGYSDNAGTSFATPHITALAAIAQNTDEINTEEFIRLLKDTSIDMGDEGYDSYYGYGIVDYNKFLNKVIEKNDIFMSPISKEQDNVCATIYNNSYKDLNVSCICACYENNVLMHCHVAPVVVKSKDAYCFKNQLCDYSSKYMVWENMQTLKPLYRSRTYTQK